MKAFRWSEISIKLRSGLFTQLAAQGADFSQGLPDDELVNG
jgi:hypothetical protein